MENYKITRDLILEAHNLSAESEPLIPSASSPIFDEIEDFQFFKVSTQDDQFSKLSTPKFEPIQTAQLSDKLANST